MQARGTTQPPANRRARPAAGTLPALQSRSQDKRDRLLQAGMQVFGEVGYEAARVADIASAAGMSVGVFYQRFKDKRALFSALEAEFVNRGAARTAHFLAAADPTWSAQTLFEQLLVSMGRVMKRNVGFFRALVSLAHVDVHVIGPVLALDQRNAELLHAHLIKHRLIAARVGPGDVLFGLASASKVILVHTLMRGSAPRGAGSSARRGGATLDTRELARLLARYLGVAPLRGG